MKIFILAIAILFSNCRSTHNPVNSYPDTDKPFDRHEFIMDNNIEIIKTQNSEITIYNPYKNKGILTLKGSMHNHTHNSRDSLLADPVETAIKFRDEGGFDFYTYTEHNFVTFDPGVPGIIWMGNAVEDTKRYQHLNIYNLPANYTYIDMGRNINKLIDYYLNLGAIICYNHPIIRRGSQSNRNFLSASKLDFVEIANAEDGIFEMAFDLLLSKGIKVFGFGVDDYHFKSSFEDPDFLFNKAYIIAFAEEKTKESIWRALLTGSFYSVRGNARMGINFNNGTIFTSSNESSTFEFIGLNSNNPGEGNILLTAPDVYEASYTITGTEGYVRVKLTNSNGSAYSQAFIILSNTTL